MKILLARLNEWKGFINDTKQLLPSPNLSFTSILIFIIFVSIVVNFLDIHGCFFFLGVICDFHPFDVVNACEAKLMLMEEFDVEIENDVEHEIFLTFYFPFLMFFCFSFHQYGHTSHF